jgi:hypothetical protein
MKFRIIQLGPKGFDKRAFGFQFLKSVQLVYLRFWFYGLYFAYGPHDPFADMHQMIVEKQAADWLSKNTNRHQRRAMEAMMRKQKHAQAH